MAIERWAGSAVRVQTTQAALMALMLCTGCRSHAGTAPSSRVEAFPVGASKKAPKKPRPTAAAPQKRGWPYDSHGLSLEPPPPTTTTEAIRIAIDPGHGAENNRGNQGAFGAHEEDFTLALAVDLSQRLRKLGGFEVILLRQKTARPSYRARLEHAEKSRAQLFVSLHSDIRGPSKTWRDPRGVKRLFNDESPGFSVLYSDVGTGDERVKVDGAAAAKATLLKERKRLALGFSRELRRRGFSACHCWQYWQNYATEPGHPGVYRDRRSGGIYVLRKSRMPAVIIETHHALDRREVRRWSEGRTRRAFALAVATVARRVMRPPDPSG